MFVGSPQDHAGLDAAFAEITSEFDFEGLAGAVIWAARPPNETYTQVFPGGRQWRLADAYLDTRVHRELQAVLDRGGVLGGSSAGATILGEYLVRGDTATNTIMMGDHEEGFGFLRNTAIDQHVLRRNRQFDLIEIIRARPELLGIGIDENTAIVVQGDEFEVIGRSYVLIYDNQSVVGDSGLFYFLSPGDQFDLATREARRPSRSLQPVGVTQPRRWPR